MVYRMVAVIKEERAVRMELMTAYLMGLLQGYLRV